MNETKAQLHYLRIAPRKVRLIANLIKGMDVNEAEAELMLNPQRAAKPILKLLRSAVSNAKNKNLVTDSLRISKITVDQGPMLKRFLPRARGMATPLQKKMSHVSIVLTEANKKGKKRFTINVSKKIKDAQLKKLAKKNAPKERPEEMKSMGKKESKPGFFRRVFNRKAI